MPTVYRYGNWKVDIYFADHPPPHFHVVTPDAKAAYEIATLRCLAGKLPKNIERAALSWAGENKALLWQKWQEFNQ